MPFITKSLSLLAVAFFANGALASRFAQFCNEYVAVESRS